MICSEAVGTPFFDCHLSALAAGCWNSVDVAEPARPLVYVRDPATIRRPCHGTSRRERHAVPGEVQFGRTFIYHPKVAREVIVERARAMLASGSTRRDVIDHIAQLRVQVTRYRHMPVARVYELGARIMG